MTKIICDYCGAEIIGPVREIVGDLDSRNLAVIEIKPTLLNQTDNRINNPDLCRKCIIKVLRELK